LTGSERRTTQRFQMPFRLLSLDYRCAVGESRNVSSRGVYSSGKDSRRLRSKSFDLPNEITLAGPVAYAAWGAFSDGIARSRRHCVVAAIERYEFLRGDDKH